MAGGKETPRQKMIGMMYLVLTALLALNVSKEILNAFVVINDGLERTNANFEGKNAYTYNEFQAAYQNDPGKVKKYWDSAKAVRDLADNLDAHIEELKKSLIAHTEGFEVENPPPPYDTGGFVLAYVNAKDNYDAPTDLMIGPEPNNPRPATDPWSAMELKERMQDFESEINRVIGAELAALVNAKFDFSKIKHHDKEEPWEQGLFYHVPLAAVITNLSKIQADVRNMEAEVVKRLFSQVNAADFKFDTLAAKVIANTNYVIVGDTYKADVFVAAFSTTQEPRMRVGYEFDTAGNIVGEPDTSSVTVKDGVAKFTKVPTSEGLTEWGGVIEIQGPDGSFRPYKFSQSFMAAKPTLVVSPTKMNVFYRGLPNPIEVSVPGVPTEKLEVSVSNASKSGSKGKFDVMPGKGKDCIVSVSADLNGKKQSFGKMEFRVKNVPDPKPYFAGITGSGNVQKKALLGAQGVIAKMENFEFDLKFNIISYVMSATVKGKVVDQPARGPRVTGDMKTLLKALRPGQKIYIEKIKAKGPDGTVRDLGTISLKLI